MVHFAWGAGEDGPSAPKNKWFKKSKGHKEALDLQETTGANLFVYFSNHKEQKQKGLTRWFETEGLKSSPVKKLLTTYIKVELPRPSKDTDPLAKQFHVNKAPAIFVVQPDGWRRRCPIFKWTNKRPKLLSPKEIAQGILSNSIPRILNFDN